MLNRTKVVKTGELTSHISIQLDTSLGGGIFVISGGGLGWITFEITEFLKLLVLRMPNSNLGFCLDSKNAVLEFEQE